jgi:hypothetical protein
LGRVTWPWTLLMLSECGNRVGGLITDFDGIGEPRALPHGYILASFFSSVSDTE